MNVVYGIQRVRNSGSAITSALERVGTRHRADNGEFKLEDHPEAGCKVQRFAITMVPIKATKKAIGHTKAQQAKPTVEDYQSLF